MKLRTSSHEWTQGVAGLTLLTVCLFHVGRTDGVSPADAAALCDEADTFHCDSSLCIDGDKKCNGVSECRNGIDESVATCGCHHDEFQCNATSCIDQIRRCDLYRDCENNSDEQDCETYVCPPSHVKCRNHMCIPRDLQCDYKDDCGDNSDEGATCLYRPCYPSEWRCNNSQCLPPSYLCDGRRDCYDGSDEQNCERHVRCENGLYVSDDHKCDGWVDCVDSQTDELNCGPCSEAQYRCVDSRCIKASNHCDGRCDCSDCGDEDNCDPPPCSGDSYFLCRESHRCINTRYVCDGHNDCFNSQIGHDEMYCDANLKSVCDGLRCSKVMCVSKNALCDGINDCLDGADEIDCGEHSKVSAPYEAIAMCSAAMYQCRNGGCIERHRCCDTVDDCGDMSDELDCINYKCANGQRQCGRGQCVAEDKWCDFRRDCLDGRDEAQCDEPHPCNASEFRCRSGQCIPQAEVCVREVKEDGRQIGCMDNSHLLNCMHVECGPGLFKCRGSYCVSESVVCDNRIDCETTHTDEENCTHVCPYPEDCCECFDIEMNCEGRQLSNVPDVSHEVGLSKFSLGGNFLYESLNEKTFVNLIQLTYLDISNNSIHTLGRNYFQSLWRLTTLNIENNNISTILNDTFVGLTNLNSIYLRGNIIQQIDPFAFSGLASLRVLDLSHQQLKYVPLNAFTGLRSLYNLNLSHNSIHYIADGAFNGLQNLLVLDISHNEITVIDSNVFHGLPALRNLYTDEFRFCCLPPSGSSLECRPLPDEFSSCEDLMSNSVLRVCVWVLGLVSLWGNFVVILWRLNDSRNNQVHSFLITNLALGDLLMGVYLLIIAGVDVAYRGHYIIYDLVWRHSILCQFAGFLSTFSSELSVFTLTLITIDRLVAIIFPLRVKRLRMREARIAMFFLWGVALALSAAPLARINYFANFYGRSGVCLALHITSDKPPGWAYAVGVFIVLNAASFVVIAASYACMFRVARKTHHQVARTNEVNNDRAMARRMTLIVLTDFCCWVPIVLLGFASLGGATIPPQVFAWVAVFVLPLNSAVNPLLYTLSTARFLRREKKQRRFKYRKSFVSSTAHSANDTRCTNDGIELHSLNHHERVPHSAARTSMRKSQTGAMPMQRLLPPFRTHSPHNRTRAKKEGPGYVSDSDTTNMYVPLPDPK